MAHQRLNPPQIFNAADYGFSQLVISNGGRTVHCSGQTAWDRDATIVGDDLETQIRQAFVNVGHALAAAGAGPADVVRQTIYVVDHKPENLAIIGPAMVAFYGPDNLPAATLIGVAALAVPDFLVEIEVTAEL